MDNGNLAFLTGVGLGALASVFVVALFGFSNSVMLLLAFFTFGGVFLGRYLEKIVDKRYQDFKEKLIEEINSRNESGK